MKPRILFSGEASFLSTGFAKFNHSLLIRLFETGKYEIAEFGAYAQDNDQRALALPWKFYGAGPLNEQENAVYKSSPVNQFGKYKFDAVVADFQPDFCFDVRDPWMLQHLVDSRFKDLFKLIIVPTVDSSPQKREWIDGIFKKADIVCTYSRFGKRVLQKEGVNVADVISPAVDLDLFHQMDKKAIREKYHIKDSLFVFGTVMRNQKRKLFPELFDAYSKLRARYNKKNGSDAEKIKHSVLYCHTSWPDVGWDLPELLQRYGIQRHVIFTYKCGDCKNVFLSWFIPCDGTGRGTCRICGKPAAKMPTTHDGVSEETLAEIYNLMDVYIQPAICEGWGLPVPESKACGVPGLYQNYSALEDHVQNGGGLELKVGRLYTEAETMAFRSLPDINDFVKKMELFILNDKKRELLGKDARKCVEKLHHWDIPSKSLINIIDSAETLNREKTWDASPRLKELTPERAPQNLSNHDFVYWCYTNILCRKPDEKGFNDWMGALASGQSNRDSIESFFRNEIITHNRFEDIRWRRSLKIRGIDMPTPQKAVLNTDVAPGVFI
jgi:glycosyltransferase involved in cell wall biosynthesis